MQDWSDFECGSIPSRTEEVSTLLPFNWPTFRVSVSRFPLKEPVVVESSFEVRSFFFARPTLRLVLVRLWVRFPLNWNSLCFGKDIRALRNFMLTSQGRPPVRRARLQAGDGGPDRLANICLLPSSVRVLAVAVDCCATRLREIGRRAPEAARW